MASIEKNFKLKVFLRNECRHPRALDERAATMETDESGNRTKAPAKAAIAGWKA
jgi:hypothetical protein